MYKQILIAAAAANDWIGTVEPPVGSGNFDTAMVPFVNNIFRLVFVGFGAYALVNFILAAFNYMNAGGEAKNIEKAKKLITQSIIALVLLSVSFLFAGIVGAVFFNDWSFILNPVGTLNKIAP